MRSLYRVSVPLPLAGEETRLLLSDTLFLPREGEGDRRAAVVEGALR